MNLSLANNKMLLRFRYDLQLIQDAKSIQGRTWNPVLKGWEYPLAPEIYRQVIERFPAVEVDEQLKLAISEMQLRQEQAQQMKRQGWEEASPIRPMPVRGKAYRHQILAYNLGLTLPYSAYFMEMGTGKTFSSIAVAGRRFLDGEITRVLIVCPASVMRVWAEEFEKFADFFYQTRILEGSTEKCLNLLNSKWQDGALRVVVINYEKARIPEVEKVLSKWVAEQLLIIDEAHKLKNPSSQQSKALAKIAKGAKYRLGLTGTPINNSPLDVFGIYRALAPSIFGTSWYVFRNRYAVLGGYGNHQIVGYKNLPELTEKTHCIAFRVTKLECLDLPPVTEEVRYCRLSKDEMNRYRFLAEEAVLELEKGGVITAQNVLSKLTRLSQFTGGFVGNEQVSTAKLQLFKEVIEEVLDSGQKAVVFARFLPEIDAIERVFKEQGIKYALIRGNVKPEERANQVTLFQQDPKVKVFVAQEATGGLGLTLTAASAAIFYSYSFSYANIDQAKARIERIGQDQPMTYVFLLVEDTVDEKIYRALQTKENMAKLLTDNWREFFGKERKYGGARSSEFNVRAGGQAQAEAR